ncbi:MAG TPA: type II secretion system protein [Anaerohalosphaeraceae bacterium]|jgi:prepilin-type N-terminal cleavage/methylation domain-containing protein|nr:type II secretion system protein [Anaerohalosphaeraceae bacterium]HRT50054.1 type II secretion system protein [Anaerohalosphaeraceae bacterium]HRT85857.1 type II secretion system protein [Anaerohalosphaeraceae bacterium]
MTTSSPRRTAARGFTLVEMLTTMAIVAILIGLLVPAFALIKNAAVTVRQKSQFEGISVALETYVNDFGDYPPSNYYSPGTTMTTDYCGAQKLAEAIVGWDTFGVHPKTEWRSDGLADWNKDGIWTDPDESIYHPSADTPFETAAENRQVRKGPYLELDSANAVKLEDIYSASNAPTPLKLDTYILADQFGKVTNLRTHKKTGMPILYWKANPTGYDHTVPPQGAGGADLQKLIYNVRDNLPLYFTAPPPFDPFTVHPLGHTGTTEHPRPEDAHFYVPTTNPDLTGGPPRPYRSDYILLSAGKDGLYGTADDVWNFNTGQ